MSLTDFFTSSTPSSVKSLCISCSAVVIILALVGLVLIFRPSTHTSD